MSVNGQRFISTSVRLCSRFDPKLFVDPITDLKELSKPLPTDDPRNFLYPKPPPSFAAPVFYRNEVVDKLIRMLMIDGRKELSKTIVYGALELVKRIQYQKWKNAKTDEERSQITLDPFEVANKAIFNCRPLMRLQTMMKGGSEYQVPYPITEKSAEFRAIKMLREIIREKAKGGKLHSYQVLAQELIAAQNNEGLTIHAKQEVHKLCEANRAYAHYRVSKLHK